MELVVEPEDDRLPVEDKDEVDVFVVRIVDGVTVGVVRAKANEVVLGTLLEPVVVDMGDLIAEAWLPVDGKFERIDEVDDLLVDVGLVADEDLGVTAKALLGFFVEAGTDDGAVLLEKLGVAGIVNAILAPVAESPPLLFLPMPISAPFFTLLSPNENFVGAGMESIVLGTKGGRRVTSACPDEVLADVMDAREVTVPGLAPLLPLPTLLLLDAA